MKVAVVTGSSRGIGKEIAIELAKKGCHVVVNCRSSEEEGLSVANYINRSIGNAIFIKADVSRLKGAEKLICGSLNYFGKIDILINNAGISLRKLFQDVTNVEWEKLIFTNLGSVFNCCSLVVPHMVSRKNGKIVNVSSIWGLVGASMEVHYSASKAAIVGFTKALAKELGPSGICVNCIAPGVIMTEMNSSLSLQDLKELKNETPLFKIGSTKDVAKAVVFLVSEDANFITGQVLSPNGGLVI